MKLPKETTSAYKLEQRQQAAILEIENCGGKYTSEQVQTWKELGLTQPECVSNRDWSMGDDLSPTQLMICKGAALLMGHEEISKLTGVSTTYIGSVIGSKKGAEEISKMQDQFFGNTKKMIEDILPLAIKTAFQVMLDPKTKPQTKADAAFRFMDRAMGRPVQQVEINDNLIRQVYEKLDEKKVIDIASKRIENAVLTNLQTPEAPLLVEETEELDSVDTWMKETFK